MEILHTSISDMRFLDAFYQIFHITKISISTIIGSRLLAKRSSRFKLESEGGPKYIGIGYKRETTTFIRVVNSDTIESQV
jgi:hypothetical protein